MEFNDTVTFTCNASGTPLWFSWQNGSSTVTAGGRVQLNKNGQNLVISGVTRYDEGPFKCIVVNNISRGESTQMNLTISCEYITEQSVDLTTCSFKGYSEGGAADNNMFQKLNLNWFYVFRWA